VEEVEELRLQLKQKVVCGKDPRQMPQAWTGAKRQEEKGARPKVLNL
jgi:hypothetical protein